MQSQRLELVRACTVALLFALGSAGPAAATGGGASRIIYQGNHDGSTTEIYAIEPDGTNRVRLTNDWYDEYLADLATDGMQIAYESPRPSNAQIYVLRLSDGQERQVTNFGGIDPSWSPDGSRLVFTRPHFGFMLLWRIDADGTDAQQLSSVWADETYADWSPDGSKIVFASKRDGHWEIYTMKQDGTDQQRITTGAGDKLLPMWSPDGTKIAYDPYDAVLQRSTIHVMNADGTGDVALTDWSSDSGCPAWSPDGRQIAFQSDRSGCAEIYTMDADGTHVRRVTWDGCPAGNWAPRWGVLCLPTAVGERGAAARAPALRLQLASPARGAAALTVALARAGWTRLDIYDAAGRHVRSILDGHLDSGMHRATWDGHDDAGRVARCGVYYCRLVQGTAQRTESVVLVK